MQLLERHNLLAKPYQPGYPYNRDYRYNNRVPAVGHLTSPIDAAIRKAAKKPTGELTNADLEKVTTLYLSGNQLTEVPKGLEKLTKLKELDLHNNQLTDVKGLEKLTQLGFLRLENNPDLTKAQIDELQKALPKCIILSNPTK